MKEKTLKQLFRLGFRLIFPIIIVLFVLFMTLVRLHTEGPFTSSIPAFISRTEIYKGIRLVSYEEFVPKHEKSILKGIENPTNWVLSRKLNMYKDRTKVIEYKGGSITNYYTITN